MSIQIIGQAKAKTLLDLTVDDLSRIIADGEYKDVGHEVLLNALSYYTLGKALANPAVTLDRVESFLFSEYITAQKLNNILYSSTFNRDWDLMNHTFTKEVEYEFPVTPCSFLSGAGAVSCSEILVSQYTLNGICYNLNSPIKGNLIMMQFDLETATSESLMVEICVDPPATIGAGVISPPTPVPGEYCIYLNNSVGCTANANSYSMGSFNAGYSRVYGFMVFAIPKSNINLLSVGVGLSYPPTDSYLKVNSIKVKSFNIMPVSGPQPVYAKGVGVQSIFQGGQPPVII